MLIMFPLRYFVDFEDQRRVISEDGRPVRCAKVEGGCGQLDACLSQYVQNH